jgi:hypothetical protein
MQYTTETSEGPRTRSIQATRGGLIVRRDEGPAEVGGILVPETARDKRGAKPRGTWGTVEDVGITEDSPDAPIDAEADFHVGQRVCYEESREHGLSEYLPALPPNLVRVRMDSVLCVEDPS